MHGRMPKGKKIENPGKVFKRLMGYVAKSYAPHLIIVAVLILVSVLANVQGTMFIQSLIDDYITPMLTADVQDFHPLAMAILRVACFYAVGVAAAYTYNRLMINVTQGVLRNLRNDLFSHMETLPIKYFDTHAHGDIMSVYTNDTDTIRQMVSQSMPQVFNSAITIVSVLVSMIILSVPLTLLTLGMVAVMLVITKKTAGLSGRYFLQQQKDLGKVNGFIEEMMEGQKVVKVFCHEEENVKQFRELNDNLYHSADRANYLVNIVGPVNMQLGNVSYVVCAIVGGILAISGISGLSLGALASFLTFNKSFNMPINQVSQQFNSIVMAMAGAERIFKMMDEVPETDAGYVTLVNVIVLHDVKLYAEPGQKIAFVGSTGAGKTTITNLINRFYDIQDGKIRYDGINVNKIKKADLRRSLGIVLQDTHLFTGTVMDNIRYGKLDATDQEVIAAAKLANADGFIRNLPEGYDTVLTGDGANLSQGQRQLLAIARAAIADPPVLILDEATSSIDTRTERIVQDGMDKLMKGRTTFVIAHRLSTVKNSDCIMVLEQGRIIERGTHDQLIEEKGKYYQLYTGNAIGA